MKKHTESTRRYIDVCRICYESACLKHPVSDTVDGKDLFALEVVRMKREHVRLMRQLWFRLAWFVPATLVGFYCVGRLA